MLLPNKHTLDGLLNQAVEKKASDVHLVAGLPPMVRVFGELIPLEGQEALSADEIRKLIYAIFSPEQRERLEQDLELDFSYSISQVSRFRGNIMWQRGTISANFRLLPLEIPRLKELNLPSVIHEFAQLPRGLVLVTGPTGSGKSTTLAALLREINEKNNLNIVTIEDPIEYIHTPKKSIIRQREVGNDTLSFADALRHVLRHDPDVIMVGEMRDLESIRNAITAAETGHLVFSTMHTQTAPLTIHRIIDVLPNHLRDQMAQQLASCLQAVVSQQLLPRSDGKGRVVAAEILISNAAVKNLIRESKEHQLYTVMQTSRSQGMQTMDQALAALYASGRITRQAAFEYCVDAIELEREMQKVSMYF
ncbi:type IV pilus twitching motility protein PilT [Heliophilum fasciatum]|uniref:Twitching motility protein PilT n=1 Tax=Heliophilum fasciatum TaxID=35700 RepID=A0A4V2SWK5_9FIRM|nr:type IV pilus twitching motility protein PilT [Heliophilum fasciatum]MCW2278642.1 twitching motility protein PilT [Heliophilum fasciatum]TCP62656.1 twitching motility protein PilT [Heliophilum fasciatum]